MILSVYLIEMRKTFVPIALLILVFTGLSSYSTSSDLKNEVNCKDTYKRLFYEYLEKVNKQAVKKKVKKIEKTTDNFAKSLDDIKLIRVSIWHRDLKEDNSLLFSKVYLKSKAGKDIALPDVLQIARQMGGTKIELSLIGRHALIDYRPFDSKVFYRVLFYDQNLYQKAINESEVHIENWETKIKTLEERQADFKKMKETLRSLNDELLDIEGPANDLASLIIPILEQIIEDPNLSDDEKARYRELIEEVKSSQRKLKESSKKLDAELKDSKKELKESEEESK